MHSLLHRYAVAAFLTSAAPLAGAQSHGLTVDAGQWPRWQTRLAIATASPTARTMADRSLLDASPQGLGVVADYYLTRSLFGPRHAGGVRATGGLVPGGPGSRAVSAPLGPPERFGAFSIERRNSTPGLTTVHGEAAGDPVSSPYVGVGYTGLAVKGSWGLTADLGLVANTGRGGLRLGRSILGTTALDDAVRDLRWSPMLQLGVTTSF